MLQCILAKENPSSESVLRLVEKNLATVIFMFILEPKRKLLCYKWNKFLHPSSHEIYPKPIEICGDRW